MISAEDREKFTKDSAEVLDNYLDNNWEVSEFESVIFGDFEQQGE